MSDIADKGRALKPKVYIVGVGPGSPDFLTDRARRAIESAEIVLGWELDLLPIRGLVGSKEVYVQDVHNYREVAEGVANLARRTGRVVAIPRVGDPCVSSGLLGLLEVFSCFDVEIIPGISSIQVAASIARVNIDDSAVVSFHDYGDHEAEKRFMLEAFRGGRHLIILTSPDLTVSGAAEFLISNGLEPHTSVVVCSNLSLEDEVVEHSTLESVSKRGYGWLSLLVVINPTVPTAREAYFLWENWRSTHKEGGVDP